MGSPFPVFRLTSQLMRQMSSPIAQYIKEYAKKHPVFSRTVCARTAAVYQRAEWRARVLALRAAGRTNAWTLRPPAPLSPNQAREVGGDLLGEIILFTLGAMIMVFELNRQEAIKEEKEKKEIQAWQALLTLLEETGKELEHQQQRINELRVILDETIKEMEAKERGEVKEGPETERGQGVAPEGKGGGGIAGWLFGGGGGSTEGIPECTCKGRGKCCAPCPEDK